LVDRHHPVVNRDEDSWKIRGWENCDRDREC
jgi:hypothetical protein